MKLTQYKLHIPRQMGQKIYKKNLEIQLIRSLTRQPKYGKNFSKIM
jgi:hypothetical protein